jgi:hypothetical protein
LVGSGDGPNEAEGKCVGWAEGRGVGPADEVGISEVGEWVGIGDGDASSCRSLPRNSSAS